MWGGMQLNVIFHLFQLDHCTLTTSRILWLVFSLNEIFISMCLKSGFAAYFVICLLCCELSWTCVACFKNYYKNIFYVEFSNFYGASISGHAFFFFYRFRNVKVNEDLKNTLHVLALSSFGYPVPLGML